MGSFDRREFISLLSTSVAGFAATPFVRIQQVTPGQTSRSQPNVSPSTPVAPCWLDVCAPFIVEDDKHGIHTEIVLTSDTFGGRRGYEGDIYGTNYEIYLYDSSGKAVGRDGVARRLTVPAMRTTV